jgi:polyphosphate kinase 2 (PPK2 family)
MPPLKSDPSRRLHREGRCARIDVAPAPASRSTEEVTMDYRKRFFVDAGKALKLKDIDRSFKGDRETAEAAAVDIERCRSKLASLQSLLYAEKKHAILIVLQALDAGGKDGAVSDVFNGFNPQGVKVTSFKEPTPVEFAHDFLWRIHPQAPAKGVEVSI